MSGPQLAAWLATAVALVALLGVVLLLVQVRRLRAAVSAPAAPAPEREPVPAPSPDAPTVPGTALEPVSGAVSARPGLELVPTEAGVVPELVPADAEVVPTHSEIAAATLSHPLVRVAALSYGIRRALREENRDRVRALVRRDIRRRHKLRRRAARRAARVVPIRAADTSREESAS